MAGFGRLGAHGCFSQEKVFSCFDASLLLTQFPGAPAPLLLGVLPASSVSNSTPRTLSSGYTVTWLPSGEKTSLLASGAPRYQHVGRVLLFQEPQGGGRWSQIQTIHGTQVRTVQGHLQTRDWRDMRHTPFCPLNAHPLTCGRPWAKHHHICPS